MNEINEIVERLGSKLEILVEETSKKRIAKKLMKLSDEQLCSLGLSRQELEKGITAYPWVYAQNNTGSSRLGL